MKRLHTVTKAHWRTALSQFASIATPIFSVRSLTTAVNINDKELVDWRVDEDGPVRIGRLTLKSPENYNALGVEMGQQFRAKVHQISHDITFNQNGHGDICAVFLQGHEATTRAFSAGGDLKWLRGLKDTSVHDKANKMLSFFEMYLCVRQIPVPVIAVLEGPALGAGAGLALACDFRTAVSRSRLFGLHFTRMGIHTAMGASHYLAKIAPSVAVQNELLLLGKTLSSHECLDAGLIHRLSDDAVNDAYELAAELARQHPLSVRLLLQTLRAQQDVGLDQALQREAMAFAQCLSRKDYGEGFDAVLERRDGRFDGYHEH